MRKKILIIDDNLGDRVLINEAIKERGFDIEVIIAERGEEGFQKAIDLCPDIVILDTNMSGMNGFETCKAIKGAKGDEIKVIIVTGAVDAVDAGQARAAGADEYCVKTVDYAPLMEIITEMINS